MSKAKTTGVTERENREHGESRQADLAGPVFEDIPIGFICPTNGLYNEGHYSMETLRESRNPAILYCVEKFNILLPKFVKPEVGQVIVVSEEGKIKQVVSSGEYRIRSLTDTEIFYVHIGNVEHLLNFSLGSRPQNFGSHSNISISYKVSDPITCLKEGSLDPAYLRPVIFRSTHESVNDWQGLSGNKALSELSEQDYKEIQKRLNDKIAERLTKVGLDLNEVFLAIEPSDYEIQQQQAKRRISLIGDFLRTKGEIELQCAEFELKKREVEDLAARKNKIADLIEYSEVRLKIQGAIRASLKDLEDKAFGGNLDVLTRALIYERISHMTAISEGVPGEKSGDSSGDNSLVRKVVDAELSNMMEPANVKMIRASAEGLSKAKIDLRIGEPNLEDLLKGVTDFFSGLSDKLNIGGK